jgi:hypothetical protein
MEQKTIEGFLITKNVCYIPLDLGEIQYVDKREFEVGLFSTWEPNILVDGFKTPKGSNYGGIMPHTETANDVRGEVVYS